MSRPLEDAELAELRARLVDCAEEVVTICFGEPDKRTRSEWRWGKRNGSVAVALRGPKRGLWRDRASTEGGDLLAMLRQTFGSFPEAVERALAITGYQPPSRDADLTPEQRQRRAAMLEADREQRAAERADRQARYATERAAEDAAAIAGAQQFWSARFPLVAPGFLYLTNTRGIPEPAGGFCADIAWHPGERAVMFAARSPSGIVTAVHLVRVDERGRKRIGRQLVKQTFGRLRTAEGQSFLKLPALSATGDELLQLAEGPENGLSGNVATGVETWVAFGSGGAPQRDRLNIFLADDDAAGSARALAFEKQQQQWRDDGMAFVVVTPWEEPRGDCSDINDVLRAGGPVAVRDRINLAIHRSVGVTPCPAPRPLPNGTLAETHSYHNRIISEALRDTEDGELARQTLLTSGAGTGKTDAIVRGAAIEIGAAKAAGGEKRFAYLVAEHKVLGSQIVERLDRIGVDAAHLRGMGDPFNPKPDDPCQNLESVKEAILATQPVRESCCGPGCVVFDTVGCKHLEALDRAATAEVVVASHNRLMHQLPKKVTAGFSAVIIDEDFQTQMDWNFTLTEEIFSRETLEAWPVLTNDEPDRHETLRLGWTHEKIRVALAARPTGYLTSEALRQAGLSLDEIATAVKLEWNRKRPAPMTPGMTLEARRDVAKAAAINNKLARIAAFYDALGAILGNGEEGRIELRQEMRKDGPVRTIEVHSQHQIAAWARDLPVLMANSSAQLDDVRRFFPRAVERRGLPVETPHAPTIKFLGGFAKSSMAKSRRKRDRVRDFLAVAFPGRKLGIVGHRTSVGAFASLPNTQLSWHGANAGDDSMKNVDVGVVFDGLRPRAVEIAKIAAARTGKPVLVAAPVMSSEPVLMNDGSGVAIPILRYEDPDAQAAYNSIHARSTEQASGRPRQVLRTAADPCVSLLFGNIASAQPVDAIIRWADAEPDRLVSMVARGRVCTNAVDMHRWHKDLFKTPKAASNARGRFGDVTGRLMKMLSRDPQPWSHVQYQTAGQGQHLRNVFCPTSEVEQLRKEAEEKYGALVHWSNRQIWNGARKDVPVGLKLDLWGMGMTSQPIPIVGPGLLPTPPRQREMPGKFVMNGGRATPDG